MAVVIGIREYRRVTDSKKDLNALLLGPPYLDDEVLAVMDEIEIERKQDLPRETNFGSDE